MNKIDRGSLQILVNAIGEERSYFASRVHYLSIVNDIGAIKSQLASVVFPWHASIFPRLLLEENETHQRRGKVERSH